MTNIFDAIERNDLDLVKALIEARANLEEYNDEGLLPIHLAAINNNFDIARFLIENGVNINAELSFGGSLIHIAAGQFTPDQLDWLLAQGMDINVEGSRHPSPISIAAMAGSLENVQWFFDKGIKDKAAKGYSLLHMAVAGNFDSFLQSIKNGEFHVKGSTPISDELLPKYLRLLEYLLKERGYDINALNNEGEKPLFIAATSGNVKIMDFLKVYGAYVNKNVSKIICEVAEKGYVEVIRWLAVEGIDVNEPYNCDVPYVSPLFPFCAAARSGKVEMMECLLELGFDRSLVDEISIATNVILSGNPSAIQWALDRGFVSGIDHIGGSLAPVAPTVELVRRLAERGMDIDLSDIRLDEFRGKLTIEIIELAKSRGCNIKEEQVGTGLMHYAAYYGQISIMEYLLSQGLDINLRNREGKTPIYYATQNNRFQAIKYLHEHGADLNMLDNGGNSLMHIAAQEGGVHIIQWLLDQGASTNLTNLQGETPLNIAAQNGKFKIIEHLGGRGVDISNVGYYAQDLVECAAIEQDVSIIKWLQDLGVDIKDLTFQINVSRFLFCPSKFMNGSDWISQYGVKTDVNTVDNQSIHGFSTGRSLIHEAIFKNDLKMFQWCIKNGADLERECRYGDTFTPLSKAVTEDHGAPFVKLLLEHGANVSSLNQHGMTPLLQAIIYYNSNKTQIIQLLCSYKANIDLTLPRQHDYFTNQDRFQELLQGTVIDGIVAGLHILDSLKANPQTRDRGIELEGVLVEKINQSRPNILDNLDLFDAKNLEIILTNLDKCKALEGLEEKIQDFNHESLSFGALNFLVNIRELNLTQELEKKAEVLLSALAASLQPDGSIKAKAMDEAGGYMASFLSREDQINLFVSSVAEDDQTNTGDNLPGNLQMEVAGEG